jgi:hypothetical protein
MSDPFVVALVVTVALALAGGFIAGFSVGVLYRDD